MSEARRQRASRLETRTTLFAIIGGRRIAASRLRNRRWVGLPGDTRRCCAR
jgi:hypothetical protein